MRAEKLGITLQRFRKYSSSFHGETAGFDAEKRWRFFRFSAVGWRWPCGVENVRRISTGLSAEAVETHRNCFISPSSTRANCGSFASSRRSSTEYMTDRVCLSLGEEASDLGIGKIRQMLADVHRDCRGTRRFFAFDLDEVRDRRSVVCGDDAQISEAVVGLLSFEAAPSVPLSPTPARFLPRHRSADLDAVEQSHQLANVRAHALGAKSAASCRRSTSSRLSFGDGYLRLESGWLDNPRSVPFKRDAEAVYRARSPSAARQVKTICFRDS